MKALVILITATATIVAAQDNGNPAPANAVTTPAAALAPPVNWAVPKTFPPDTTKLWPGSASLEETQKAADQGDPLAQCAMGDFCIKGSNGVPADASKAVEWYQKSAAQGYAVAQFRLALKYSRGTGITMDEVAAASWFQKAVDQGNKEAARHLADMYSKGRGPVKQDYAHALALYERAVELSGDTLSECFIADLYAQGLGVAKDKAKALELYQDAANAGGSNAQCALGDMYATGTDLPKDLARAYAWYSLATSSADPNMVKRGTKGTNGLELILTPEQKTEAARLVQEFRDTVKKNKRPFHF